MTTLTPFLLNFTDGRTLSLVDRFDLHNEHDDESAADAQHAAVNLDMPAFFLPPFLENGSLYGPDITEYVHSSSQVPLHDDSTQSSALAVSRCSRAQIEALVTSLQLCLEAHPHLAKAADGLSLEPNACALFEPVMATRLIESYFRKWHLHAPIIHQASFNADRVEPQLLLVLILMGAMFYARHAAALATDYLDVAEAFVFESSSFRIVFEEQDAAQTQSIFELLQAALIVVIMQDRGHDLASRRRMRLHRFIDVVSVARKLNIFSLVHADLPVEHRSFAQDEWERFASTEAKIRYGVEYVMVWIDC